MSIIGKVVFGATPSHQGTDGHVARSLSSVLMKLNVPLIQKKIVSCTMVPVLAFVDSLGQREIEQGTCAISLSRALGLVNT